MCEHCKVAYSFFFGVQYHKAGCPALVTAPAKAPVTAEVARVRAAMTG